MITAYAGIDVAFAKKKVLPVVVCAKERGSLVPLSLRQAYFLRPPLGQGNRKILDQNIVASFATKTLGYLRAVENKYRVSISRIAIDSPSEAKKAATHRRKAELALFKRRISCITTPDEEKFESIKQFAAAYLANGGTEPTMPHANQLWMLVGFELFRCLREEWECLEVYPQATVALLGVGGQHKSKKGAFLR
jgi:hypothetical protein